MPLQLFAKRLTQRREGAEYVRMSDEAILEDKFQHWHPHTMLAAPDDQNRRRSRRSADKSQCSHMLNGE